MSRTCSNTIPPLYTEEDNKESKLNKKLNEAFPNHKNGTTSSMSGVNEYYHKFRTDENLIKWIGTLSKGESADWTTQKGVDAIREEKLSGGVLDEYGEPVYYEDTAGNPYIRNAVGDWMYVRPLNNVLSPEEWSGMINSLTGDYVVNTEETVTKYVDRKIEARYKEQAESLKAEKERLEEEEDIFIKIQGYSLLALRDAQVTKLRVLHEESYTKNLVVRKLKARLQNYNYKFTEDAGTKEDETYVEETNDIGNFILDSDQTSNRAINDALILNFLSSVPSYISYEANMENQNDYSNIDQNRLLGSQEYMSQSDVWGHLESLFSNVLPSFLNEEGASKDVFENYLTVLKNAAEKNQSPLYNYVYDYLSDLENNEAVQDPEEFKNKMVTAFFRTSQKFLITQVNTNKDKNGKSYTTFKIIDPSVKNNKVTKLADEYMESVASTIRDSTEESLVDQKVHLAKRFKEISRTLDRAQYEAFVNDLIKKELKLNVPQNIINHFFRINTGGNSHTFKPGKLKKAVDQLLTAKLNSPALANLGLSEEFGEFKLFQYLIDRPGAEKPYSKEIRETVKEVLMAEGSFFKSLAVSSAIFTKDVAESSFIVGGNKRWAYSSVSGLDLMVERLKTGDPTLYDRLSHRNLTIMKHLEKNPEMRDMLQIYTNSEIKNERDNNPTLHKKITSIDQHWDNFVKMFNSKDVFYDSTIKRNKKFGAEYKEASLKYANYAPINFAAEKNSMYSLFGLPTPGLEFQLYDPKNSELNDPFKQILDGYLEGEIYEAEKASREIQSYMAMPSATQEQIDAKQKYLMENLVPGYHYNIPLNENSEVPNPDKIDKVPVRDIEVDELIAEDFRNGSYYTLGIFSKSTAKFNRMHPKLLYMPMPQIDVNNRDISYPVIDGNFFSAPNFRKLMDVVYSDVNQQVLKDYQYLKDIILIRKKDPANEELMMEIGLFDIDTNIGVNADDKIFKYITSSFLLNYELSNIFNGHIEYYKQKDPANPDLTDFLKRAPAAATDGKYLRHRNRRHNAIQKLEANKELSESQKSEIEKNYYTYHGEKVTIKDADDSVVAAVVNNIDVAVSEFADKIARGTNKKSNFSYELADAQGVMTPEHFKDIVTRIYGWNANDTKMHNELMDPKTKITDAHTNWIKTSNKSNTPLKMVYFKVNDKGEPVYFKYSLSPLYPSLTNGTDMQRVIDQMQAQGVEQVVFKSGSKASNPAPTTIHNGADTNSFDGIKDEFKFNPFELDTSFLKMQVELPTKLDKETKLGIQSIKNIMTNMDLSSTDRTYELKGENGEVTMHTAQEMYDKLQESMVGLLQRGLTKALKRLGHVRQEDGSDLFDITKIKSLLIDELDIETERDLLNLLKTDAPIETVPGLAQRAYPKLSAYLTKTAGKIYTNGGSVVQVANMGFDRLTKDQKSATFFFNGETKLTPPLPRTDKDGNILYFDENGVASKTKTKGSHMKIEKAKILMPFSSLFKGTGLSYEDFIELYKKGDKVVNRKIFETVMGYRIPNQSMASNDSFEIVGILPPMSGDQAIVYHEITAKTGSDFDIDKMYLATANIEVEYENNYFKRAKDFIKNELRYGENDILQILKAEGFPSTYEDANEMNELFIREIIFNTETDEGETFADTYGAKKVKNITYSKEGYKGEQNKFVELMNSVIESPSSYNDLMSPLDSDILKDTINKIKYFKSLDKEARDAYKKKTKKEQDEILKQYTFENKPTGLEQMFPVSLINARVDMLEAKTLISIMSNNMTDLGESQKVGFDLKYDLGLRDKKGKQASSLDLTYMLDEDLNDEMKLSKIVSYMMNASVDAAKDNYIIEGNLTSYSANSALMMTRLGINMDDLFTINMNDEILKFSEYKKFQRAKLSDFSFDYDAKELDSWSINLLRKIKSSKTGDVFSVITRDDFLDNNPEKKEDILGFWNLIQTMGKEFNNAVVATKSDSNGAGKNISEFISLKNRVERLKYDVTNNSEKKWFKDGRGKNESNMKFNPEISKNPNVKMLGAMANNTLFLMESMSKNLFMETTPRVVEAVQNILAGLGTPLDTSAETISLIYNYLYPNLLYQTDHEIYNIDAEKEDYLLRTFPRVLQEYKKSERTGVLFLSNLRISTNKDRNLIEYPSFKNFSDIDMEGFKQDLVDIMNDMRSLPEDHEFKHVLDDLVQYAFLTTGMKNTFYSFHSLIPATYYVNKNHGAGIQLMIDRKDDFLYAKAMTLMAQTHHKNYKIVKKVPNSMTVLDGVAVQDTDTLKRITMANDKFVPFLDHNKDLFLLIGEEDGYPIYAETTKIENKDFNTYSFNGIDDRLHMTSVAYESPSAKLFADHDAVTDPTMNDSTDC